MNKGLLTLLLLFTCFARAQVVDTWQFANPQQQERALNIASQLRQTLVLWALPVVLLLLMALILWRVRAKR